MDDTAAVPEAPRPFWRRPSVVVPAAIVGADLVLRLVRLGEPGEIIPLDEQHYVPDARAILQGGSEGHFVVHPYAGKLLIALGMRIFGRNDPFGWRFSGAILGTIGVLLVYLIGMRLWGSRRLAAAAAALLALEGLWFVQSRVAMLDIYLAFFLLLAAWLLVEDRVRTTAAHEGRRWWRLGAGAALGLALSSKFLAIAPHWALLFGIAVGWEITRLREGAATPRERRRETLALAGTFVVLPVAVYVASWGPWFLDGDRYLPPRCERSSNRLSGWVCYQREIYDFHRGLDKFKADGSPAHPYFGEAWSWPWAGRPIAHYYETEGTGPGKRDAEVLGLPNPVIWFPAFFAAIPLLGWWTLRRRDETAAFLWLFIGAGWLPYLLVGAFDRPIFFFYATPIVPFIVLGVVHALGRLFGEGRRGAVALAAYVLAAAGMFAFFYPVLAAVPIPHEGPFGWRAHIWLDGDCTIQAIKDFCWI